MKKTKLASFKAKAFANADVKKRYDELKPAYDLRRKMVAIRHNAGLTQEEAARKLRTSKSNISRLESATSTAWPNLATISSYAEAMGYEVRIDFVRKRG